jgi:hypothetical protein
MRGIAMQGLTLVLIAASLSFLPKLAGGQETSPEKTPKEKRASSLSVYVFHVDFTVREMDGTKVLNARKYSMSVTGAPSMIRVGNRVPIRIRENEIRYEDIGMNIDCRVDSERENDVVLASGFEWSSIVGSEEGRPVTAATGQPVLRHVQFRDSSAVPLGKPTIIGVVDDVLSTHRYEVEVKATKVE